MILTLHLVVGCLKGIKYILDENFIFGNLILIMSLNQAPCVSGQTYKK